MLKHLFLPYVLITFCGCATHRKVLWSTAIYEKDDVYVLDGTEVLKTASLFTVHGTFQKFTFPIKRAFKVYRHSDQKVILNKVSDEGIGDESWYDYFADGDALVVRHGGWKPKIQNLSTGKSFYPDGLLVNPRQARCRHALVWKLDWDTDRSTYFDCDTLTGRFTRLRPKTVEFIGDQWHTYLCLNRDATLLARMALVLDAGAKALQISVWDLQRERLVAKSPPIRYEEEFSEFLYFTMLDESIVAIYLGSAGVKEVIVNPTKVDVKTLDVGNDRKGPVPPRFVEDDIETVTMFYRIDRSLRTKRFNLRSGATLRDETIELPLHAQE